VVTYDIDGNREGVLDNRSGFVLPPFDRDKLSESLALLLEDEARRRRMGEAGRAFALERFDARVMVEALESVYRSAVQTPITTR
jgi:glycosyltransferase involved in cell wall biosynthesis